MFEGERKEKEGEIHTAIATQQMLTYGDNLSPIRAHFQKTPRKLLNHNMWLATIAASVWGVVNWMLRTLPYVCPLDRERWRAHMRKCRSEGG